MKFHKLCVHATVTLLTKSASYQIISPHRHISKAAYTTHYTLHNIFVVQVTYAHVV